MASDTQPATQVAWRCQNASWTLLGAVASIQGVFLGIDPGLCGAIAVLREYDGGLHLGVYDMPTEWVRSSGGRKRRVDGVALARLIDAEVSGDGSVLAIVERVSASPQMGVTSSFSFGYSYGMVTGILAANFVTTRLVTPQVWKRAVRLPVGADKSASRACASAVYPSAAAMFSRAKDDGRAEAALMAWCGLTDSI